MESSPPDTHYPSLAREFVVDFLEAAAYVFVLSVILDKKIDWTRVLKISTFLAIVQSVLMIVDQDSHRKVKEGINQSFGNSAMNAMLIV
jgi:hypothetical protein